MTTEKNPYRFIVAEPVGGTDDPPSPFRQPETGRKLSADELRTLAFSQRGLWICSVPLALWLCVWLVTAVAPTAAPSVFARVPVDLHAIVGPLLIAIAGWMLLAWVGGLVFVLAIASRTHTTWLGFVLWFFAMYPPILLLMVPYLQSRAARELRRHGIPANLSGADRKSLPKAGAQPLPSTPTPGPKTRIPIASPGTPTRRALCRPTTRRERTSVRAGRRSCRRRRFVGWRSIADGF